MFYTQATLGKINKDVVTYFETEAAAKRAAKRQAKDKDYTAVWYGNPNRMQARIQVKGANKMTIYTITNKQALEAIRLAHELKGAHPDDVTKAINASECPRALFVLASVLAAATAPGSIINEGA